MGKNMKLTEFDQQVTSESVQIMKAMIPYAPPSGQRFLSVFTKFMELQSTMNMVRSMGNDMSICQTDNSIASPMEMINHVREYCSPTTQGRLDEITNAFAMMEMMELMRDSMEDA